MPIAFTCPYCGAQTNVADPFAGRTGPCACCGVMITVPGAAGTAAQARRPLGACVVVVIVLGGAFFLLAMLAFALLPMMAQSPELARRAQCQNQLRQIGVAIERYHDAFGTFPPAYLADKEGRPMHSWRVLLLPYLGEESVYQQYDFDEPWDGPKNRRLARAIYNVYACPADTAGDGTQTSYLMLVGPEAISDGPRATKLGQIKNDPATTILVVEVSGSSIGWMEPRDLSAGSLTFGVNDGSPSGIRSGHRGGAAALMADGHVEYLDDACDPEWIKEMSQTGRKAIAPID